MEELASLFSATDNPPSRAQLKALHEFYDADSNGLLDFWEFKRMHADLASVQAAVEHEEATQVGCIFRALDQGRKGFLTADDLGCFFPQDGTQASDGQMR